MERIRLIIALLILGLFLNIKIMSQDEWLQIGKSMINTSGTIFEYPTERIEIYNSEQWIQSLKIVAQRKREYLKNGWTNPAKAHPKFILPLKPKDGLSDPGYNTITAYFDHDTLYPGHLLDYMCSDLTYDLDSGYNHQGTDFFLWPYPWQKMKNDEVEVIAAASGMVLLKQNGNFDRHCEPNTEPWNGICILHEDGSTSWYIHLKKNSLTNVGVGQNISQGDYLGIVGSSGSSLAPHLHFEVLDPDLKKIDPFIGTCNEGITESWWEEQLPYKEPGVNRISTHAHLPVFPECPEEEIPNESIVFYSGDSIFLLSYFKNISNGDKVEVLIQRPDQSDFANWVWFNPNQFYTASWVFFLMILNDDHYGAWTYKLKYNDIQYSHGFELKNPQSISEVVLNDEIYVFPSPTKDNVFIRSTHIKELSVVGSISNSMGQKLGSYSFSLSPLNLFNIDVSMFPCGVYYLRLDLASQSLTRLIIKK